MKELNQYLRPEESVLWESAPQDFPLMETHMKWNILLKWCLAAAAIVAFFLIDPSSEKFGLGAKVLVTLVGVVVIVTPLTEYRSLRKQRYFLTDQRAIVLTGDNSFYYIDYSKIDDCQLIEDVAQGGCIAMGSIIMADVRNRLRWQSCHPRTDNQETNSDGTALGLVFYQPEDVGRMVEILEDSGVKVA